MTDKEKAKAKAYDEALERAKKYNIDDAYSSQGTIVKLIFPELRESEDERMIERIELSLHSLKQWINGCDEMQPSRKEECITEIKEQEAWLEKQKEQKSADLSEMMVHKEPYIAPVPTPMVADEQKPYEPKNWPADKDSLTQEQKPAEWSEKDEVNINLIISYLDSYIEEHNDTFGADECKGLKYWVKSLPERFNLQSELSEEDVKMIGRIRSVVNECASYNDALDVNGDYCEGDYAKLDAWLKSLPLNLKKKNEDVAKLCSNNWSIEDEDRIRQIERIAQQAGCTQKLQEEIHDWLKSLRPHWKPSEEQLE